MKAANMANLAKIWPKSVTKANELAQSTPWKAANLAKAENLAKMANICQRV